MKRRTTIFLFLFVLLTVPLALLAQGDPYADFPFELNDAVVAVFQTVFGLGLLGLVQLVKGALKKCLPDWADMTALARHAIMYTLTALISAGVTYFVLSQMGLMGLERFVLYSVYAWGVCNGFWKALKEIVHKHA